MVLNDFEKISSKLIDDVLLLINQKGVEYQSDEDVLSNFKNNAKELGLTKYQVWSIYFTKHTKSIINQIKNNPNNPQEYDSIENTKSRLTDAIAYLLFLNAMIEEDSNSTK